MWSLLGLSLSLLINSCSSQGGPGFAGREGGRGGRGFGPAGGDGFGGGGGGGLGPRTGMGGGSFGPAGADGFGGGGGGGLGPRTGMGGGGFGFTSADGFGGGGGGGGGSGMGMGGGGLGPTGGGGFGDGPGGRMGMGRRDGIGSGAGGVGGGGECPVDRRIAGFQCAGRGTAVTDCPRGSTCMVDRASGGSYCCWDSSAPVEAPCDDPLTEGSTFVQCTPGDRTRSCPGSCHRCQVLSGMDLGLCCPQLTQPGCENSSPLRNEFEAARRRITGSSPASGGVTGSDNRGVSGADRRLGGMDFGMTGGGGGGVAGGGGAIRAMCPDGFPPTDRCATRVPCRSGQICLQLRGDEGACCPIGSGGMGGRPGGMPGMPGLPGGVSRPLPGLAGDRRGTFLGMSRGRGGGSPRMCADGFSPTDSCAVGRPCRRGDACVQTGGGEGICCPLGSGGMGGGPGMPGIPGMPGRSARFGPGGPGAPGMPDIAGRRASLEMLRQRGLQRRMQARRQLLARRGPGMIPGMGMRVPGF